MPAIAIPPSSSVTRSRWTRASLPTNTSRSSKANPSSSAREAEGADRLERLLKEHMAPVGILDALADTEHWLGWSRHFGPISGFETKLDKPRERYLATTFCYGCGLGPTQAARSLKGLDRRHVAFVREHQDVWGARSGACIT